MRERERCTVSGRSGLCLTPIFVTFLTLVAVSRAADEPSEQLVNDFDTALAREHADAQNRSPASWQQKPPAERRLGLDRYWPEAVALAKAHGPVAVEFLQTRLATKPAPYNKRSEPDTLAQMTLAALADDERAATALTRRSLEVRPDVMAITYAPDSVGRAIGREVLAKGVRGQRNWTVLQDASILLRFYGEAADADRLEAVMDEQRPRSPNGSDLYLKSETEFNLAAMRQRLAHDPREQTEWTRDDIHVWRTLVVYIGPDTVAPQWNCNYEALAAQTRLSTCYLRDRLSDSPIHSREPELITSMIISQRETTLIPDLAEIAQRDRSRGYYALRALLSLGTTEAIAAVKRLIPPPPKPSEVSRCYALSAEAERRAQVFHYLTQLYIGNVSTADLLDELSRDAAYPPDERAAFKQARDHIRLRLDAPPGGMMGGTRP